MPNTNVVPPQEKHIYDELLQIRDRFSELKKNSSHVLNSTDVIAEYDQILKLAKELHTIRSKLPEESQGNKVDQVLDDVFQVLSLFFMAVGLTKTAPATYASLTTVQRLLEHLNESVVFTQEDIVPIKERLSEINDVINDSDHGRDEFSLLKKKLNACFNELKLVESKSQEIDPELSSISKSLVLIKRGLLSLASKPENSDKNELERYRKEVEELASKRDASGKFKSLETGNAKEKGQNVLNGLLDDCNSLLRDLSIAHFELDPTLKPLYEELTEIKKRLQDLLVTRRWTLRETDIYTYQKRLQEVDDLRVNGKFPTGENSNKDEHELNRDQAVLLYLLRRCYAIIYKLLESSEPVSESLQPVHNQLSTVRRCLLEVKRMGGVNNSRELYPYQMKLASLDNLREDGKFIVNGQIPEGQGTLNALLAECYDIIQEMRIEAEERQEESGQEDEDQNLYENDLYERDDDEDDELDEMDTVDYDDIEEED